MSGARRSARSAIFAAVADLSILVLCCYLSGAVSRAQEFRIDEWRAYALVGTPGMQKNTQYVSFSGHHGLQADWLPNEDVIEAYTRREAALLSNFQLRVVTLGLPLPGLLGSPQSERIERIVLQSLTTAGFDVGSRANSHSLDLGSEGVRHYEAKLKKLGLRIIGERESPVFHWQLGNRRIDIAAAASVLDRPDPERLILRIDSADLAMLQRETEGADFRIAVTNLGSASRYPSPHEREVARRLFDAGFGLVVCSGSHFIKGFLNDGSRSVAYGIGDHLLSIQYGLIDTEPLGMYLVAGFQNARLSQIFVIPFHNDVRREHLGPLDETDFSEFVRTLRDRSTSDDSKYFSDAGALQMMTRALRNMNPTDLRKLRPRHFVYASHLLLRQRPEWVAGAGIFAAAIAVMLYRRRSVRRRANSGTALESSQSR
jgi:hypothetical protein